MTEKSYGWLLRLLGNSTLLILLVQSATTVWANDDLAHNLLYAGRRAFENGNYRQAEDYFRQAAEEARIVKASEADLAPILGDLGSVLLAESRFAESEPFLDRAITIVRSGAPVDRRLLPILLGNLGRVYHHTGRIERSEAVLREALRDGKKFLADDPMYLSDLHNNIGVLHLAAGKRKKAERDFKAALTLIENDGPNANDIRKASIMANLSTLYFMDEKWSLAEQTLLRSIEIVERSRGTEHPSLCKLLENLGYIYLQQGDLARAEAAIRRELSSRKTVFGMENATTATAAATLANVLAARGEYDEAGKLFAEALNTQERLLGRAPEVAITLDQFANLLRRTNNNALAGDLASRAESIRLEAGYTVSLDELRRK